MTTDFRKFEKKWQIRWERTKIFEANVDPKKKKFFITFPYPYMNGGPHIGAAFSAFRCDIYARFKRMQGFNVLYPQGFHATGEPILGAVKRLMEGDVTQIETFELYGANKQDIEDFKKKGPKFIAKYWMKRWIEDLKRNGFSIDWRRTFITTTLTPQYSRFIEWQYNTLRKNGYVVQGTHPVVWCPKCQSPTGDHDRLKGEGESPIEYILLKFKLDTGEILPCGTLRPETIYGVTNIWINPDIEYVAAKIDGEKWIMSKGAAEKLKDQLKDIDIIFRVKGKELIGKFVENPVLKDKIIILPASFVDPDSASGIVMSVPSHAPYDWIGLKDLIENPKELEQYKIDPLIVRNIKPVSMIKIEGFGDHPAIEICEKMGIKNQKETEKLDQATEIIYKKEFHTGILKENVKDYAGMKVSDVKESIVKDFVKRNVAEIMWELTGKVVCRCMTPNHVKILENQWFLKFSDENWKKGVREAIAQMKFYPEFVRTQFENTVEWLNDKACTRRSGLGTPLPWDKQWIIETLSDSVIYMAYYTIARIINEKKIPAEKLSDEVFDYIFLGIGNLRSVAKKNKLKEKIIDEMRREFEYFYPLDFRTSGKDLVQNHLTFFIFHHTAIWNNPNYWPKAIAVNGFVNVSGTKMSKSKGNIVPLRNLAENIGSDLVRINIVGSNEELNDAEWRDESVASYRSRIEFLYDLIKSLKKMKRRKIQNIDIYLQSKLQEHVKNVTENYELTKFKTAIQYCLFDLTNDLKWYIERVGGKKNASRNILEDVLATAVKLLSPIIPHTAEEFWSLLGNKHFVSIEKWPVAEEKKINKKAMEAEEGLKKVIEDIIHVIKLAGMKKNAFLYAVSPDEFTHLNEAKEFIRKRFGFKKFVVFRVSDKKKYDPQNKSTKAKYGKPGIYLE